MYFFSRGSAAPCQASPATPFCAHLLRALGEPLRPFALLTLAFSVCLSPLEADPTPIEGLKARSEKDLLLLLDKIKASTGGNHGFLGNAEVRRLRAELETLTLPENPGDYLRVLTYLGSAEVDLGQLESGIGHLQKAHRALAHVRAPESIRALVLAELGNAYLRLAESENCCARYSPESCIVPLQGAAIHQVRRGSEAAAKVFEAVVRMQGAEPYLKLKCLWLLNLAHMTLGDYPQGVPEGMKLPPSAFTSSVAFPRFPNTATSLGIDRFNLAGGAVFDDFDGDDDLDLITSCWDPAVSMSYFENQGAGQFSERTKTSRLDLQLGSLNLVQADYDNDGDLDLYVLRGAWLSSNGRQPNSLLQNQGDGTFIDRTFEAGLGEHHFPSQTAAWGDYDLDGDLDLYVGNENQPNFSAPSQLFRNNGDSTFTDVAEEAGVTNDRYAKGVVWGDADGDRWPDIVVSNLEGENRLYHNNKDGTFSDIAKQAGVTHPIASFPAWTWDFNNDGHLDIFICAYASEIGDHVLHYLGRPLQKELPGHYQGNGKGRFVNRAQHHGLDIPMLPMGCNIGDLDNDGYLDFYLGTGEPNVSVILPNMMFLNQAGQGFVDVTMAGGFGHLQKGHAIAFADFDDDGDQDVFEQMGGAKPVDEYRDALFENPGFDRHWLQIKLVGTQSNRSGIGARIHVRLNEAGENRSLYRFVGSGGSFGANPLREHIGLGTSREISSIEVFWPASNLRQTFRNLTADQFIEITEGEKDIRVIRQGAAKRS